MLSAFISLAALTGVVSTISQKTKRLFPLSAALMWFTHAAFYVLTGKPFLAACCYLLPTYMGTLYLTTMTQKTEQSTLCRILFVFLNIACMIFFATYNATGATAWMYTLYWLIPALNALIPHNNFFMHALGATFTTHAFGAVQWLVMGWGPAQAWIALIPIVACERILCALSITVAAWATKKACNLTACLLQHVQDERIKNIALPVMVSAERKRSVSNHMTGTQA